MKALKHRYNYYKTELKWWIKLSYTLEAQSMLIKGAMLHNGIHSLMLNASQLIKFQWCLIGFFILIIVVKFILS
jgi:hypothetical protein